MVTSDWLIDLCKNNLFCFIALEIFSLIFIHLI